MIRILYIYIWPKDYSQQASLSYTKGEIDAANYRTKKSSFYKNFRQKFKVILNFNQAIQKSYWRI